MLEKMRASPAWLAGRSLVPSTVSFTVCVVLGLGLSLVHLLVTCVRQGAILPNFLDGQWAYVYGTMVQQPLKAFLGQATFNNVVIVILWGFAGLLVYTIVEHLLKNYHEWRTAKRAIQLINPAYVIQHPLQRNFFTAILWRVVVTCLFIGWSIIALIQLQKLAAPNALPFFGVSPVTFMVNLLWMAFSWAVTLHIFVVLLRLAVRRTRLFGRAPRGAGNEVSFFRA